MLPGHCKLIMWCFRGIWWNFRSIIQSSHCEEDTQEMWFLCFDIAKQHHEAICFQSRWVSLNEKTVSKWKFTLQSGRMSHTIFILNLFTKILSRSEWVHLVFCNKGGEFFAKEHIQYCKTPSSMQHRSMKYFKIASLLIMIHNALLSSKITLRNSWFLHSTLAKINLHREGLVLRMMRNLYTDCSSKVVDDMISFLGIVMSKSELSTFRQTGWCSCSLQVKNKNVVGDNVEMVVRSS